MPTARQIRFAASCTLTVAFVWGVIWYPFRFLREAGITPQLSSFLVYSMITVAGVTLFWPVFRRHWRLSPHMLILLLAFGWTNFGYTKAMTDGVVMRALLLFYLTPLWTALLSWLLLKEKLSQIGWGVVGVSLLGCAVILWDPKAMASGQWLSQPYEWMALSAGIAFSFGQTISRKAQSLPPVVKSSAIWLGTAVMGFATASAHGELGLIADINLAHWLVLLLLAVVLISTSVISQFSLTVLTANQNMTLMLTELVIAAASAFFLAGELMQPHEWLGGALIVGASLFSGKMARQAKAAVSLAPAGCPPQPETPCMADVLPVKEPQSAQPAAGQLIRRRNIEGEATRPLASRRRDRG